MGWRRRICAVSLPLRVLAIQMPLHRVAGNVLTDCIQLPIIANHPVMKAVLPQPARISRPPFTCNTMTVLMSRKALEPPHDRRKRDTAPRRPARITIASVSNLARILMPPLDSTIPVGTVAPVPVSLRGAPHQDNDPMQMVGHDHKFVNHHARVIPQPRPYPMNHRPSRRMMHPTVSDPSQQGKAPFNAEHDKICALTCVIVRLQARGAAIWVGDTHDGQISASCIRPNPVRIRSSDVA